MIARRRVAGALPRSAAGEPPAALPLDGFSRRPGAPLRRRSTATGSSTCCSARRARCACWRGTKGERSDGRRRRGRGRCPTRRRSSRPAVPRARRARRRRRLLALAGAERCASRPGSRRVVEEGVLVDVAVGRPAARARDRLRSRNGAVPPDGDRPSLDPRLDGARAHGYDLVALAPRRKVTPAGAFLEDGTTVSVGVAVAVPRVVVAGRRPEPAASFVRDRRRCTRSCRTGRISSVSLSGRRRSSRRRGAQESRRARRPRRGRHARPRATRTTTNDSGRVRVLPHAAAEASRSRPRGRPCRRRRATCARRAGG